MSRFEPGFSGIGSDLSANYATNKSAIFKMVHSPFHYCGTFSCTQIIYNIVTNRNINKSYTLLILKQHRWSVLHKTSYCDTIKNCRHQDPGHMCPMFRVMCEEALTYTINLPTLMLTQPREVSHSMKPREGILNLFWTKIILKVF